MEKEKKAISDYSGVIQDLRAVILQGMDRDDIPGLAIAMVEGHNLIWAEGFGFTDRHKKEPVTAETPFSLQSAGKTYTAAGFLIAASKGHIHLDEPLRKYYPEFRVNSRFAEGEVNKITFRHLLSHWSGLCHEAPVGNNYDTPPCTFEEHIHSIADTWLRFPVGERWSYSNLGMDLVAYALQRVYGKSFAEYMQDELLMPLGMAHSTYDQAFLFANRSYARGHRGGFETPVPYIPMLGAGGLFAPASDVAKFLSFQLARGAVNGRRLIDESLVDEMYRLPFPVEKQVCGYGLGILIDQRFGATVFTHPGGGYGYQAVQSWIPKYDLGVAVCINKSSSLYNKVHEAAFKGLITAKYGAVPDHQPLPFVNHQEISVGMDQLRRLEGSYRGMDSTVTIRSEAGQLSMGDTQVLRPYSATGFTTGDGTRVTFSLDAHNRPVEMQVLDRWGFNRFAVDRGPSDEPGPGRPAWRTFTGIYRVSESSTVYYAAVSIQQGYLNINGWMGEVRLLEYGPALFFTTDGEAVIFSERGMSYGNARHVRDPDPYRQLVDLAQTHPGDRRLSEGALVGLGKAYMHLGEPENAAAVLELSLRLHPESSAAYPPLIQAYRDIGDEAKAAETQRMYRLMDSPATKS